MYKRKKLRLLLRENTEGKCAVRSINTITPNLICND